MPCLATNPRQGNPSTMGGFHCPPSYEKFHHVTFGWTRKYFGGIHRLTFGWTMNSTLLKKGGVFELKSVLPKGGGNPWLQGKGGDCSFLGQAKIYGSKFLSTLFHIFQTIFSLVGEKKEILLHPTRGCQTWESLNIK